MRFGFWISSSFTVANFIEGRVTFGIFAKQCAFDHRKRNLLTVYFRVDRAYAGRAIECSQCSEHKRQRLRLMGQAADTPPLNLDRPWAHDPPRHIQVQFRCPA